MRKYQSQRKKVFVPAVNFLMVLFGCAHFLHQIIVLFNLWLKVLRWEADSWAFTSSVLLNITHRFHFHTHTHTQQTCMTWSDSETQAVPDSCSSPSNCDFHLSGRFVGGADGADDVVGGVTSTFNGCVISKSFLFSCQRTDFRLLFDLFRSLIWITLFLRHFCAAKKLFN